MLRKTRLLIFSDWYEPGFKAGGPIQSCKNTVNTLTDEFDVWVFTSDRDLGDKEPYRGIETDKWIPVRNGAHVFYASPGFLKSANLRKMILEVKPDSVYLNSMFSSYFSLLPLWLLRSIKFKGRIVLAPRGMLSQSAVARKKWKKKIFLTVFALSSISRKIIFHATCKPEENDIRFFFGKSAKVELIEEIPNLNRLWNPRNKHRGQLNAIFISRIHPIKNLLFAINVMKKMAGCSVVFDIYGPIEDRKYFQTCREYAAQANDGVTIKFKGAIANDKIFSLLQQYHLFFLPTLGENFGHVLFESLTSGCVLLVSDKTPWRALDTHNVGWDLPLKKPAEYLQKVNELCDMDEETFNRKSRAAFEYAQHFVESMKLKERYSALFQRTG